MVLESLPGTSLIGCTTAGDFSRNYGFSDDSITLILFCSDTIEIRAGLGRNVSWDHKNAIRSAVSQAREGLTQSASLCIALPDLFYNSANQLVEELSGELRCTVVGGFAARQVVDDDVTVSDLPERPIAQFYGGEILNDALPILLFGGPVEFAFSVANSWIPVGQKAKVTQSAGREVKRIGELKALDFYRHYLGEHADPAKEFPLAVCEPGQERFYLRVPVHYDDRTGAISFSEAIPVGATVQITESVRDHLIEDARGSTESLYHSYPDKHAVLALAFSCCLRKEALGTRVEEELSVLRETLSLSTAIAGFYSNGEIAPLSPGDRSFFHNATLVTVLIGERGQEHKDGETTENESANRRRYKDIDVPEDHLHEDLKRENEFLKRKLARSEVYRRRLEDVKDLNASLHRKLIHEIDAAKQEIEQKEKALRQSEEKYRRIVETAGEGFLLADENLIITDVNDAYCRMLGYERHELIGKSPMDLATEDFRQFLLANRESLLAKDYRRFEGKLVSKHGVVVPVLINGNTLRASAGNLLGHMAFVADLSETKKALMLAAEVQRSFLPQASPRLRGLEIAGKNIPCEEIGGDYFDYLSGDEHSEGSLNVVVGDITGHGVDAALLMTGACSFLRSRVSRSGTIAEIISEMNRHLTLDVFDAGRFMTLFYLALDLGEHRLRWVRAGHDPALLYDPHGDTFQELKGRGMALGVDESFEYEENSVTGVGGGQIIAIGTDGIWEAHNKHGEMFGKARFRDTLRRLAEMEVEGIIEGVFEELKEFTTGVQPEDDATLVVMRVKDEHSDGT
jgi:PAS domain S-box-containing protein